MSTSCLFETVRFDSFSAGSGTASSSRLLRTVFVSSYIFSYQSGHALEGDVPARHFPLHSGRGPAPIPDAPWKSHAAAHHEGSGNPPLHLSKRFFRRLYGKCQKTFIKVDFPAPFSPIRAWTVPGRTQKSTLFNAFTPANSLQIPRISSKYSVFCPLCVLFMFVTHAFFYIQLP